MIHDHEALELASAALDFELNPTESRALADALADCPVCAERAAAYREQRLLLAELPRLDVSAETRRRVTAAALSGRTEARPPILLLAAALLLGLVLAGVAIVGAMIDRTSQPHLGIVDPTTSPRGNEPSPSLVLRDTSPVPSAPPGAVGRSSLPADSIAEVVSRNVRVRSEPRVAEDSIRYEPFLQVGDRLFVIQGPVVANDYEWYEVAPIGMGPTRNSTTLPSGWVARSDHDGTPWIAPADAVCPEGSTEIEVLSSMHPFERLACFGGGNLAFRAFIQGEKAPVACELDSADRACIDGPSWLAGVGGWIAASSGATATGASTSWPLITIEPAGSVRPADLSVGRTAAVEGSFDHQASTTCRSGPTVPGQTAVTLARAVLECRARFVVSRAVPATQVLDPGTAAVTVTENLRVRTRPEVSAASIRLSPLLQPGTRLFVVGGPHVASGYDWYEVVVPSMERADAGTMVGWVAVGSKTGERWVGPAPSDCPAPAGITVARLGDLTQAPNEDAGLVCFGRTDGAEPPLLRFEAGVHLACGGVQPETQPGWLSAQGPALVLDDEGRQLLGKPHPDLVVPFDCTTAAAPFLLTGQFDHPDAAGCTATQGVAGAAIDDRVAVYRCRSRFVVTALDPVGG